MSERIYVASQNVVSLLLYSFTSNCWHALLPLLPVSYTTAGSRYNFIYAPFYALAENGVICAVLRIGDVTNVNYDIMRNFTPAVDQCNLKVHAILDHC